MVNTVKNIFQLNWNRKLLNYVSCVLFMRRYMAFKPVMVYVSCVFDRTGFGEIGEFAF